MDSLKKTLQQVMAGYSGQGLNGYSYLTISPDEKVFAVVVVAQMPEKRVVHTSLLARIKNNCIIIEHDANNKPLVDALLQAGVPRNQIVLAYAGEATDEAA